LVKIAYIVVKVLGKSDPDILVVSRNCSPANKFPQTSSFGNKALKVMTNALNYPCYISIKAMSVGPPSLDLPSRSPGRVSDHADLLADPTRFLKLRRFSRSQRLLLGIKTAKENGVLVPRKVIRNKPKLMRHDHEAIVREYLVE
jgi:hypothetical protein